MNKTSLVIKRRKPTQLAAKTSGSCGTSDVSSSTKGTPTTPQKETPHGTPYFSKGVPGGSLGDLNDGKKPTTEQLLELASGLTAEDKRKLLDHLALEVQNTKTASKKDSRDLEMWSSALFQALERVPSVASVGPLLVRKQASAGESWDPIATFMRTSKFCDLSVPERQSAYNLLAELLVAYAKKVCSRKSMPLSLKFILNCTQHLAAVFEQNFPGYLGSGLGPVVIRQAAAHRDH